MGHLCAGTAKIVKTYGAGCKQTVELWLSKRGKYASVEGEGRLEKVRGTGQKRITALC